MASYWKSQPRHFCEICKCWLSANKASIEFHERGKSHQEKKEKHITTLRKKSALDFKHQQKAGYYLKQMEDAALTAYKNDLAQKGLVYEHPVAIDNTHPSNRLSAGLHSYRFVEPPVNSKTFSKPSINDTKTPSNPPKKSPWSKQVSPEGSYYWNSETGKSQWEKPEGFIETTEESAGNSKTVSQSIKSRKEVKSPKDSKIKEKESVWTEQVSPEGHSYYWNSDTGKSQWEKPEGFISTKPATNSAENNVVSQSDNSTGEAPAKRPRVNPYGSWSVVREPKPKKQIDWQLPIKPPNPVAEGLIDRSTIEKPEPVKPKFKEKVVPSLGDEGGSTIFKKKNTKQRSIRKRIEDD